MQKNSQKISNIPKGSIIPYYIQGLKEPWFFNGINQSGNYSDFATRAVKSDPFQMSTNSIDPINQELVS